jgi:uncharacterized protein (TIGR03083 family)
MLLSIAEYRALLQAESDRLLSQLDDLTDEDWRRQSPCDAWDVLDVVVHLQLGTWVHNGMIENGLAGKMESPWPLPDGVDPRAHFRQVHEEAHAQGPAENVALLRERFAGYLATLDRVTDADLNKPAWFYGLPADLRKVITAFVNDVIIHATDIRRPAGIEPLFSTEGARFVGWAGLSFLPMFVTAERLGGASGTVRQTIDGDVSAVELGEWGLRLVESPDPSSASDASLTTDGATWALLTWRGYPPAEAEAAGALQIGGDRALVERYLAAIKAP